MTVTPGAARAYRGHMKIIRAISLAAAFLVPVAAFASPSVRAASACCTAGSGCCPDCPFCLTAAHAGR